MYRKNSYFLVICAMLALVAGDARAVSSVRVLGAPTTTSTVKPSVVRTGSLTSGNTAAAVKKATAGSAAQVLRPASSRATLKTTTIGADRIPTVATKANIKSISKPAQVPAQTKPTNEVVANELTDKVADIEARLNDIDLTDYYTIPETQSNYYDKPQIDAKFSDYYNRAETDGLLLNYDTSETVDQKIDTKLSEIEAAVSAQTVFAIRAKVQNNEQNITNNTNQINALRSDLNVTNALLESGLEDIDTVFDTATGTRKYVAIVHNFDPTVITGVTVTTDNDDSDETGI